MKVRSLLSFVILAFVFALTASANHEREESLVGNWTGHGRYVDHILSAIFKMDGGKLTGTLTGPRGVATPLTDLKVTGDEVSFVLTLDNPPPTRSQTWTGKIVGDDIIFAVEPVGGGQGHETILTRRGRRLLLLFLNDLMSEIEE